MKSVNLQIDENIYNNVMFLLNNLNLKGLIIKEMQDNDLKPIRKKSLKEFFKTKDISLFKEINDPLEWQKKQRDESKNFCCILKLFI